MSRIIGLYADRIIKKKNKKKYIYRLFHANPEIKNNK